VFAKIELGDLHLFASVNRGPVCCHSAIE